MTEEKTTKNLINVLPSTKQIIHRKLAKFCVHTKADDLYFFYEATDLLMSEISNDDLKKIFKDDIGDVKRRIPIIGTALRKVKMYYDGLDDKTIKKEDLNSKRLIEYEKQLKKIPLMQKFLFGVWRKMLVKTNLKYMAIPNEAFKTEMGIKPKDKGFEYPSKDSTTKHGD